MANMIGDRGREHMTTIDSFWDDPNSWAVTCTCGFEVEGLSSEEAAHDTVRWHHGEPSALGGEL